MEEVWNDINLSSLHQFNDKNRSTHNRQTFHFQDFFSSKPDQITPLASTNDTSFCVDRQAIPTKRHSTIASTTLSLNTLDSGDQFHFGFGNTDRTLDISLAREDNTNINCIIKKRAKENSDNAETNDQRNKRLMKSRESADRSRARKQAYTNGLEQEVARLRKENAKLRNQMAQFYLAAPIEVRKKPSLSGRTLTAPF